MEEKQTIPLPAEPVEAGRRRTIIIAACAVVAVSVGVVSIVAATSGPAAKPGKAAVGDVAATGSSTPYVTDSGGGYSQQPQFTWSPRGGAPPPAASSKAPPPPVADSPPSVQGTAPFQPVSVPAPPPVSASKPPTSAPKTSAPPPPPPTSKPPTPYQISGTVSCLSGHSVEGVWVQAAQGAGYSPWQGIGNGSTSRYYYTLPSTMAFSLHVGCGGTQANWAVVLTTAQTPGPVANFTCHDVSGQANYGTCELQ